MEARGNVHFGFSNASGTWSEDFDLVDVAQRVLAEHGLATKKLAIERKTVLYHDLSGFSFDPVLVDFQPLDPKGARSVTVTHITHPTLFAQSVFEYQHSTGDSVQDSIARGLDQWARLDLPTLLDAARPKLEQCTAMEMEFPATETSPSRRRRVVMGPVASYQQHPEPPRPDEQGETHPPFCVCCLFTKSMDSFNRLLEDDGFYALRLFAMRDENGEFGADCRINGEEFEQGKLALRHYASTWPGRGIEFRKQYVIIQTLPTSEWRS